jgi:hypothetical protein
MANQAVYGILGGGRSKAEHVVQALVDLGVNPPDISFLSSQGEEFREFVSTIDVNRNWRTEERVNEESDRSSKATTGKSGLGTEKHTKAPEGATTGAATGDYRWCTWFARRYWSPCYSWYGTLCGCWTSNGCLKWIRSRWNYRRYHWCFSRQWNS